MWKLLIISTKRFIKNSRFHALGRGVLPSNQSRKAGSGSQDDSWFGRAAKTPAATFHQTRAAIKADFTFDGGFVSPDYRKPLMRHTISVLVENKFGVLTRIAGMFSGRGFNIDTLNVGPTLDPSTSRMTIVVRGDDTVLEQVTKQLNKLIDVIEIQDFREDEYMDRELVMLRVNVDSTTRAEVMQICDIFRAKIIDVQHRNVSIEVTGNESKINKFLLLMENFGINDLTRTGKVALARKE